MLAFYRANGRHAVAANEIVRVCNAFSETHWIVALTQGSSLARTTPGLWSETPSAY
jgi:hypothetical protein